MGGENEGTGIWGGLDLVGSKLRGQEAGGTGSSAIGGGWGELESCFKGYRG